MKLVPARVMVTTIGAALWCTTGKHPCDTGSTTRACGCTPRFGVLHDVAATAAALGKLGYAVEVCSCSSTFDIGVDEHGTLWESAEAYEANKTIFVGFGEVTKMPVSCGG